jgi:hypothetical protein
MSSFDDDAIRQLAEELEAIATYLEVQPPANAGLNALIRRACDQAARLYRFVVVDEAKGRLKQETTKRENELQICAFEGLELLCALSEGREVDDASHRLRNVAGLLRRLLPPPAKVECYHNADFTEVNWYGRRFTFNIGNQAKSIESLWGEWEKDVMGLHEKSIGEGIGSSSNKFRLAHHFKDHPAWGVMIHRADAKGCYRLHKPKASQKK